MPKPSLTAADIANFQTASIDLGLATPAKISWVLYEERDWKAWQQSLVDAGFTSYKNSWVPFFYKTEKYDGYALLTSLVFDKLKSDGDLVGVSIPLPNGSGTDYSGFGWVHDSKSASNIPISTFTDGITNQVSIDVAWLCSSYPANDAKTLGYCYHFQPEKSSDSGSNYRWSAGDSIHPVGWSNISGVMKLFDLTNGTGVTLMSATHFGLQIAATASAIGAIFM